MKENFKILFAGGGTGGHLFSGIAVAEEIRRHYPHAQVLFVGTPLGLEKEIVPECGFPLEFIQASPLKGSGIMARIKSLVRLPGAYRQSKKILKSFQPDIVVGIGGYASGPMTLAAHFSGLPTAIIEQNSIPGFTNRQLARFADRIFVSFAGAQRFFDPKKTEFTGNPARKMENQANPSKKTDRFCVFILGGSQGAHALNVALMGTLPLLEKEKDRFYFIHQTGPNDFEEVRKAYAKGGFQAEVFPFKQDLGQYYAQADFMICRAGAGTITELQNLGLPSLLIPYPHAADDHQFYNAREMVDTGAAEMIRNQDLSGKKVAEKILSFQKKPEKLHNMQAQALRLAKPKAAETVLTKCLQLIRSRG